MDKESITFRRISLIFAEWGRRCAHNLASYIDAPDYTADDYGDVMAETFMQIATEMDADGKLPVPDSREVYAK